MNQPPKPPALSLIDLKNQAETFIPKFQAYDDRALVIVGAAYLEDLVRELLRARLVDDESAVNQAFDRALFNAAVKVEVAYLVGIIGPKLKEALLQINLIRNRFAHLHQVESLKDPAILEMTRAIMPSLIEKLYPGILGDPDEGRLRFIRATVIFSVVLMNQDAFFQKIKPGPGMELGFSV